MATRTRVMLRKTDPVGPDPRTTSRAGLSTSATARRSISSLPQRNRDRRHRRRAYSRLRRLRSRFPLRRTSRLAVRPGFVYASPHIRGGRTRVPLVRVGPPREKVNTFTDFIAGPKFLAAESIAAPGPRWRAGRRRLLIGAVANLAPERLRHDRRGAVVDVLTRCSRQPAATPPEGRNGEPRTARTNTGRFAAYSPTTRRPAAFGIWHLRAYRPRSPTGAGEMGGEAESNEDR